MTTAYVFESIPFPAREGNPRNGEGDVVMLADGRLLMVFGEFYGTDDAAPATLQGVYSDDCGRTWHGQHTVQENIGGRNVMSASLLRLDNGEIMLGFLRKDEEGGVCTPFVRRSVDEGRTWSEPAPVVPVGPAYHVVNNARLVQMQGGRILMPVCVHGDAFIFISDDCGRSWRATSPHPFLPGSNSGAQEPGVIELKDGRVMMWCRCDLSEIYRCWSGDGGETFGPWEPMGLKAPCSPAAIRRLPSTGDLLCLFNNHDPPPEYWACSRAPLTAALSRDEGKTWRVVGDLEPDRTRSYCYVSIIFLPKDEILVTYYHGRDQDGVEDGEYRRRHHNLAHLKVGIFRVNWLYGCESARER